MSKLHLDGNLGLMCPNMIPSKCGSIILDHIRIDLQDGVVEYTVSRYPGFIISSHFLIEIHALGFRKSARYCAEELKLETNMVFEFPN